VFAVLWSYHFPTQAFTLHIASGCAIVLPRPPWLAPKLV